MIHSFIKYIQLAYNSYSAKQLTFKKARFPKKREKLQVYFVKYEFENFDCFFKKWWLKFYFIEHSNSVSSGSEIKTHAVHQDYYFVYANFTRVVAITMGGPKYILW